MRSFRLLPLVILLIGAAPLPPKTDDAKLIQGTWTVVSLMKDGKNAPEEETSKMSFIIKDNTLVVRTGARTEPATIKLDPTKKPKTLDLSENKESGAVPMIYEVKGDDLRICWNERGKDRPTSFDAERAKGMVVLKRKK